MNVLNSLLARVLVDHDDTRRILGADEVSVHLRLTSERHAAPGFRETELEFSKELAPARPLRSWNIVTCFDLAPGPSRV